MAQAKASDYQLDADATKSEIPDQVRNDIIGKPIPFRLRKIATNLGCKRAGLLRKPRGIASSSLSKAEWD
jgi:hypothetical protein